MNEFARGEFIIFLQRKKVNVIIFVTLKVQKLKRFPLLF